MFRLMSGGRGSACGLGMGAAPLWEIRGSSLKVIFSRGVQSVAWGGGAGAAGLASWFSCLIGISPCHRG